MQSHPTKYPTDLSDEEWNQIKSLVPAPKSGKGKRGRPVESDRRSLVNAIFYVVRAGCAWRLLPGDFPPWQTVYGYFRRLSQTGVWEKVLAELVKTRRLKSGRNEHPTLLIIDAQSIKNAGKGEQHGFDGGKKNQGTKAPNRR